MWFLITNLSCICTQHLREGPTFFTQCTGGPLVAAWWPTRGFITGFTLWKELEEEEQEKQDGDNYITTQ